MFLMRLYLFVCVNLFLYAKCSIPVEKLCADPTCKEPISEARGTVKYTPHEKEVLSFHPGQEITITSKSKNATDYWGAVINGKSGYVPSNLVKEYKVYRSSKDLIPVADKLFEQNASFGANSSEKNIAEEISNKESGKLSAPQSSEAVVSVSDNREYPKTVEKPIEPAKTFDVIEGTTIYIDDTERITPSATVDAKSTPQTVAPIGRKLKAESISQQDRATIPPELINLNSNVSRQNIKTVNDFTIESVKQDDENSVVESNDIDADEDEGEDVDEDDEDEEEEEEEENEDDDVGNDLNNNNNNNLEEQVLNSHLDGMEGSRTSNTEEKDKSPVRNENSEKEITFSNIESPQIEKSLPDPALNIINPVTEQLTDGDSKIKIPVGEDSGSLNILNNHGKILEPSKLALNILPQHSRSFDLNYLRPQAIISEPASDAPPSEPPKVLESKAETVPQSIADSGSEGTPSPIIIQEVTRATAETPQLVDQEKPSENAAATPESKKTPTPTVQQIPVEPYPSTPQSVVKTYSRATSPSVVESVSPSPMPQAPSPVDSRIPDSDTPPVLSEIPSSGDTSKIIPQFSVSADVLADKTKNAEEPPPAFDLIQEGEEVATENFATTPLQVVSESEHQVSDPSQTTNAVDVAQETAEETTEVLMTPSDLPESPPEELKNLESLPEMGSQDQDPYTPVEGGEQPGILSQITGMLSGWFASSPEEGGNVETPIEDLTGDGKAEGAADDVPREAPSGTCSNPESGFECKDFVPVEEQTALWSRWIPMGLTSDSILTQSNTLIYLIVTAVTVLLFTLGHNLIEKRGKTGPLIAKINKLEHELLVTSKECALLKEEVQSAREKISLYENSANDELIISLQAELEESKKVRVELESSIEVLQQELDAATEAGLDLNKMLSEVLTQKGGSESLLKSVESLQAQLDSQQKVIDEMTKKLGVKNQENEALQSALESANEKTETLEEELNDMKHNLNLHLKEKEDLTRDLNSQIKELKKSTAQLGEEKEKEISGLKKQVEDAEGKLSEVTGALTVKEEEVNQLKESMKELGASEAVFDVSRIKAELAKEAKECQSLLAKLQREETSKKALKDQLKALQEDVAELKKKYEEAEQKRDEAEKKLEVLSTYFKEKETQLQKELGLQEALWAQKKGDEKAVYNMMKSLQEEVESYRSQNETLKKEILDQERGLKSQMATLEQKAHENWVAARQAERKLEESKQEMAQLRNRLTLVEKNSSAVEGKGSLRSSEELNGVEAASPIHHDTSSPLMFPPLPLDPNGSNLLPPGFMPPPMFMPPPIGGFMPPPPFLPGDRRPPPLGRMSSPPLNSRFSPSSPPDYSFERMSSPPLNSRFSPSSPADYPFERMSSPPLSPPGSNV